MDPFFMHESIVSSDNMRRKLCSSVIFLSKSFSSRHSTLSYTSSKISFHIGLRIELFCAETNTTCSLFYSHNIVMPCISTRGVRSESTTPTSRGFS
jgi:hypothetical protein